MKELMIRDMKTIKVIGYGLWVIVALLVSAPVTAQSAQEWQTSSLPGSGSAYSSQVTAVGSSVAASEATTTESYTPGRPGAIRRDSYNDDDWGVNPQVGEGDEASPIGDAVLPLLLFAATFAGVIYLRRKRSRTLKADN